MPAGDDHAEILRARERLHKLEAFQYAAASRLRHMEQRLDRLEPSVEALVRQDELAEAVADKVKDLRGELFTGVQKVGALTVGLVALADFVRGLIMG